MRAIRIRPAPGLTDLSTARDQGPDFRKISRIVDIRPAPAAYISGMEEAWDDPDTGFGTEPSGHTVVYRTQREVDAIFARLRAWRERGRTV